MDRHGADRVAVLGDSAGGQIALSAALMLRDRGLPPLSDIVLISPALELSFSNPEIPDREETDPWLAHQGLSVVTDLWRGDRAVSDPIVSPLLGDVAGLGRVAIFSGTRDILNPDAGLLHRKLASSGIECIFREQPEALHVYPLLPGRLGKRAQRDIVERIVG